MCKLRLLCILPLDNFDPQLLPFFSKKMIFNYFFQSYWPLIIIVPIRTTISKFIKYIGYRNFKLIRKAFS